MLAVSGVSVLNNYARQEKLNSNLKQVKSNIPALNRIKGNDVVDISGKARFQGFAKNFVAATNQQQPENKAQLVEQSRQNEVRELIAKAAGSSAAPDKTAEIAGNEALKNTVKTKETGEIKEKRAETSPEFQEETTSQSEVKNYVSNFNLKFIKVLNPILI